MVEIMKKLSILIPTIASRAHLLNRLLACLLPQRTDEVEVIVMSDDGEEPIGRKRNRLLAQSQGAWVVFVDDDDLVSPQYVARILKALELNPDCVGFWVNRYVNGVLGGGACHSLRYSKYATRDDGDELIFERTPNHLNPIRREIALKAGFPEKNWGEDSDYAKRVYPLLESEVFIDEPLYDYLYTPNGDRPFEMTNEARHAGETPEEWFARHNGGGKA